jgi:DNA-binding transcriptional ArsR family regulator
MVEYKLRLDDIFSALSDATRRDILKHVSKKDQSIGQLAKRYDMSFAAVSKHLMLLEKAQLVQKRREGKQQIVQLSPEAFASAEDYLGYYRKLWEQRFNALEDYLQQEKEHGSKKNK